MHLSYAPVHAPVVYSCVYSCSILLEIFRGQLFLFPSPSPSSFRGAARFLQKTFEGLEAATTVPAGVPTDSEAAAAAAAAQPSARASCVSLLSIVEGRPKKEAARMFFETLVSGWDWQRAGVVSPRRS